MRHFHEKLVEEHGIELSYRWVKLALQGAGLVKKRGRRGTHRRRRPRRALPGLLLHIDASQHAWFQDERYYDLITILGDATSEIDYAQVEEEEGTRTLRLRKMTLSLYSVASRSSRARASSRYASTPRSMVWVASFSPTRLP